MTVTSPRVKLLLASLRVKVINALSVAPSSDLLLVMAMVGGVVSRVVLRSPPPVGGQPQGSVAALVTPQPMLSETTLLLSPPSLLASPVASVKRSLSMNTAALVAPAKGVKVAV